MGFVDDREVVHVPRGGQYRRHGFWGYVLKHLSQPGKQARSEYLYHHAYHHHFGELTSPQSASLSRFSPSFGRRCGRRGWTTLLLV